LASKLTAASEFFELFPEARIALVLVRGIDNRPKEASLAALLEDAQAKAVARLQGGPLAEHPRIHCWREAYRAFGAKPKDYPSSIENLARRALKGEPLRSINPLVDLYNVVSLTHLLPAGGEDLDAIVGDIVLTRASADEPKVKLLGEGEERAPKPGEVIYKDGLGAICRRWNWKEAERTKLTEGTRNAVLVLEAIPPILVSELENAARELEGLVLEHCGGSARVELLDRQRPEAALGPDRI
jgi:DNA/RNA-binding domain of Phe-tRNA-synthetase-like protein